MPELRTDWLTGRSVLVAENRANRPNEFDGTLYTGELALAGGKPASSKSNCPFCPGNESLTPPAVFTQSDAHGNWRLRIIPNKFPALSPDASSALATLGAQPAFGVHEVIVEAARHVDRLSALSLQELRDVLAAYSQRLAYWRADGRFRYGLVFKNQGARAGASLSHVHSQLMAMPILPANVERESERAEVEFQKHDACPYCRWLARERADGTRIVADIDGYVAFCPFASLQPSEVWILPAAHEPWFEQSAKMSSLEQLAGVLHSVVGRFEALLPQASYNLLLRTSPWDRGNLAAVHWRIELLPRITPLAGLELATGVHINPLPPEAAAQRLRNA